MNVQRTSRYMTSPVVGEPDVWTVRTEYVDDDHTVAVTRYEHPADPTRDHVGVVVHPSQGQLPRGVSVTAAEHQIALTVGGVQVWLTPGEANALAAALVGAVT